MAARDQPPKPATPLPSGNQKSIKTPRKRTSWCCQSAYTYTSVALLILAFIYANFGPTPRKLLARQLIRATRWCGQGCCFSSDDQEAESNIMLMCTHSCINCFSIKVPSILLAVCLINARIVYLWKWKAEMGKQGKWWWVAAGWEITCYISCQSVWPPVTRDWPAHPPRRAPRMHCLPKSMAFFFRIHFLTLSMSFASIKCVCAKTWKLSFECFNYTPS